MKAMRRGLLLGAAGALLAPRLAWTQQPKTVPHIAWISGDAQPDPFIEGFREGLRRLGYVEGKTIAIEYATVEGKPLAESVAELVASKVDVIVAVSSAGVLAAKNATTSIPIIMTPAGDPVESGLIASLAQPGGNITGQSILSTELMGKRLELLKEVVPGVSRIAVFFNPRNPAQAIQRRVAEAPAKALRVTLQSVEVQGPDDFERAFQTAADGGAGALVVLDDPLFLTHRTRIASVAVRTGLPV